MKKLIIWGTGKACRSYEALIKNMEAKGMLEVLGQVLPAGEACAWKLLKQEEALALPYDGIVIATNLPEVAGTTERLLELGVRPEKLLNLSKCLLEIESEPEKHEKIVAGQIEVLKRVLAATDEEMSNPEWMKQTISDYGMYPFDTKGDLSKNWTHFGLMQMLEEFASFCVDISKLENITKAIEVGVYRGRSSYFMCAILRRKNPNLSYKCVDIYDNLDCFDMYKAVLPALEKCIPSTSEDYKNEAFDFVFIDADHSYDGSMADYRNVGVNATRIACFHDIYGHEYDHENGGTVRSWKEIAQLNQDKTIKTYSIYPEEWMGIGTIWL